MDVKGVSAILLSKSERRPGAIKVIILLIFSEKFALAPRFMNFLLRLGMSASMYLVP